jgi:hypothetical protein
VHFLCTSADGERILSTFVYLPTLLFSPLMGSNQP